MESDLISRQGAIDLVEDIETKRLKGEVELIYAPLIKGLRALPSDQPAKEILAWLLAYHQKSFELHGRYMAHEVIGWLVHDFASDFMEEES